MLERTILRCDKTPRTTARWRLCFLTLLLTMVISTCYNLSPKAVRLLTFWTASSLRSQTHSNVITSVESISSAEPPTYFVAYPHRYVFLLDEPHRCWQESPFLVIMIPVAPHNRDARDTIRNTWGKETTVLGRVVSHYFLLGLPREDKGTKTLKEQVLQESQMHHDILQSDFLDSYNNLTIKTMVMFEWLSSHCPKTSYAMKIDSDTFLNVHNLVDMISTAPRHLYMTGLVVRGAVVDRDLTSKWFLPVSVFPDPIYPPYVIGLAYVFSLDLPKRILEASAHVKAIYIEDVYVGLCMRHLGITLTNPPRGDLFRLLNPKKTDNCYWTSVIATVLQNSNQITEIWQAYQNQVNNFLCVFQQQPL